MVKSCTTRGISPEDVMKVATATISRVLVAAIYHNGNTQQNSCKTTQYHFAFMEKAIVACERALHTHN
jgi:hypothetical protein